MTKIKAQVLTTPPKRVYSPLELADFDGKIQRFYNEKTLEDGDKVRILNWNELAVAYGAHVRKPGASGTLHYLRARDDRFPSRADQFYNLMNQWEDWKRGKDWRKEYAISKQDESYEQLVRETDVQDELF